MAAGVVLTSPIYHIYNLDGSPCPGGQLFTYLAGTTTPSPVFLDSGLTTPAANPVVMDASGEAILYLGARAYKLVEKNASGVTLRTVDNVQGNYKTQTELATVFADIQTPIQYVATTGAANAYVATPAAPWTSYVEGKAIIFKANFTNTAAATINVSGLGARNLTDNALNSLPQGAFLSGARYLGLMADASNMIAIALDAYRKFIDLLGVVAVASYSTSGFHAGAQFLVYTAAGKFLAPVNGGGTDYGPDYLTATGAGTKTYVRIKQTGAALTAEQRVVTDTTGGVVTTAPTITGVALFI